MYKMIGGDGREYGPIAAEQLRQWFQEGRVNGQTRIQAEGSTEWQLFSQLPEFADLWGAPATPPPAAPPSAMPPQPVPPLGTGRAKPDVAMLTASYLGRDYQVKTGEWLRRAWDLIKRDFWLLVGASFVAGLLTGTGVGFIIGGPMLGGLYGLILKKRRGQPASFGDAFSGFSVAFVPLMLGLLVSGLLTALGGLLCLLPGIYLGVSWIFTLPLIHDKGLDFWDAMELSRKVVGKHWWGMFGFVLVAWLLAMGGFLLCCVGVFVTTAIMQVAIACAYEDIFGNT